MENLLAPVLVLGNKMQTFEVAACLYLAGHQVTLLTTDVEAAKKVFSNIFTNIHQQAVHRWKSPNDIQLITAEDLNASYPLAVVVAGEAIKEKSAWVKLLESKLDEEAIITVNMESIPLTELQKQVLHPQKLIGLNWTSPAYNTFFLELISNEQTEKKYLDQIFNLSKKYWAKDPYALNCGKALRSRMMAAMFREAAYLVENGYATVKDIDRACRNDAGFYLPFAGNFRYMDLMGTYAYGLVMKDLNPELATNDVLPAFFTRLIEEGSLGIACNKGFYPYNAQDKDELQDQFNTFSFQIRELMAKYLPQSDAL